MINTPTRDPSKANDRALLQAIALSLNPRLRTVGRANREVDCEYVADPSFFGGMAGDAFTTDV